ncbi:hypothetical protein Acr_00g0017900 [Actinidia rufa]|uniref:Uncharacterized protein n=1 Tax=Actinidia rufa TaxID=165716 RepID=A0A7J0DBA0_9ERIC|nr:hypothetical protein Acr_00g0017900 [Actinidia rufa]
MLKRTTSNHWKLLVSHHICLQSIFSYSYKSIIGAICGKLTLDTTKLVLMASRSNNGDRGNREAQGEYSLMTRTLCERGTKLLADAEREVIGPSE